MYPVGGKSFRSVEERSRAVQALGKRVIDANSRGGQATCEELKDFHAMTRDGLWNGGLNGDAIVIAYAEPARVFPSSEASSGP